MAAAAQEHGPLAATAKAPGISRRSVLLGTGLSFLLNFLDAYSTTMIRGSYLNLNFSAGGVLFLFFFLVLANAAVAWGRRALSLDRTELIVIYFMMIVAACVPSMGFTQFIIPCLVGSFYYATPENNWDFYYNQYIPSWMVPQGDEVRRYFFEGLPAGMPVPWEAWVGPLTFWYGFFLALSLAMICGMVILRKQWMDKERLVYPLVQVPLELIQRDGQGFIGMNLLRSRLMWAGFLLAFALISINGLNYYYPYFPKIERFASIYLFRETVDLNFWINPAWTGFFYFVKLDISASIWVFYLLTQTQRGVFNLLGIQSTERVDLYSRDPYLAHQGFGAMIAFVVTGLWLARGHLREVFRQAAGGRAAADDSREMLSYRQAAWGLLGGTALVGLALWLTGLPPLGVLVFLFGALVVYFSLTRSVAEGGVPSMRPPLMTSTFVISTLGTAALGPPGLVALGFTYGWHAELRTSVMAAMANGLKLAEGMDIGRRGLLWLALLALVAGFCGSTYMMLHVAYKYGGINLAGLFFVWGAATCGPKDMVPRIADLAEGPRWDAWLFSGIGGGVMALLMWVRHRFLWWPLNPLGYFISSNWKTGHIFFPCFVAWLFKSVILKYGGPRLYRDARPFFLGLILGEILGAGTWLVLDYLTGHTDNFITKP
jgi:hypothetical protein